jgi:hypothetical protein
MFLLFFAASANGQNEATEHRFGSVTDADLKTLPLSTESIELRGSRGYGNDTVTDTGIEHLTRLSKLRSLKAGALGLTDAACISIGKLIHLEELALDGNEITGAGLKSLTSLKHLRRLVLNFNNISEDDLVVLKEFSELEELHLSTLGTAGDKMLEHCSKLPKLQLLHLPYEGGNITDAGIQYLVNLKQLRNLKLANSRVTNNGLAELSKLTNLETLFFYNLRSVKPGSLSFMSKLDNLKDIEILDVPLSPSDIDQITSRPKLQRLVLWNVFSDRDSRIARLGRQPHLVVLRTNAPLTHEAVEDLQHAENLQSISDGLTNLDNKDIAMLSKLPKLDTLYLDSPLITADALQTFAKMKSLRTLMVTQRIQIDGEQWTKLGREHLTQCFIQQLDAPFTVFYEPPQR